MSLDLNAMAATAAESEDLTKASSGFTREVPREGVALLRLRDYIETGRHEPKNPQHKPALKCILTFELMHPDHMIEIDGKKVNGQIQIRLNKGKTATSGYRKLFKVLNDALGGGHVNFLSMINKPLMGKIYHNVVGEGDKAVTYANLDKDGAWSFVAPRVCPDPVSAPNEFRDIPVGEMQGEPKVFMWENNSFNEETYKAMWDSIFIEGTRTVQGKDGAADKEVSKNWIQELIRENIDWEGSTAQSLFDEKLDIDALTGAAE